MWPCSYLFPTSLEGAPCHKRNKVNHTEMEGEGAWHRHGWLRNVPCDLMFL